ncbi:hypothetical protein PMAYCL1PPCAC_15879 [Pristionchus mayeri]|uniref:Uncharacterized protein n=1 Tax=Pristionchus mayeri TaxID=1317129 RepID=A0AAN5CJR3_9BILA|nr:hypothetical protein PMAYCL1PPCAC_15879 [Pristionchus mayeri]
MRTRRKAAAATAAAAAGTSAASRLQLTAWLAASLIASTSAQLVLARPPSFVYDDSPKSGWAERMTVVEGAPLSLHCPTMEHGSEIFWRHNDSAAVPDATAALLHIDAARRDHAVEWRCGARNAAGAALARPTIVSVLWLDDFVPEGEGRDDVKYTLQVPHGAPYDLRRPALLGSQPESRLQPVFLWYCNDAQVYANSTHYLTARGDLVVLDSSAVPRRGTRRTSSGTEERCEVTAAVEGLGEFRSRSYYVTHDGKATSPPDFSILYGPIDEEVIIHDEGASMTDPDLLLQWDCVPSMADANVRWFLDDRPLTEAEEGVAIERSGRRLIMAPGAARRLLAESSSTKRAAGGGKRQALNRQLECKADAGAGRLLAAKSAKIKVLRPPRLVKLPDTIYRMPGGRLELSCTDTRGATPQKGFRWTMNGEVIGRSSRLSLDVGSSSYGVYACEARNGAGVDVATTFLQEGENNDVASSMLNDGSAGPTDEGTVEGGGRFTPDLDGLPPATMLSMDELTKGEGGGGQASVPSIVRPPQDTTVAAGEPSFTLECAAQPVDSIVWKFNESLLAPSAKYSFEGAEGGRLVVHEVRASDAGVYTCEARTRAGATHASARVTVAGGSLLEYGPTNQSILIGTNIELPCQVAEQYRSTAEVSWYFQGERIPASGNPALGITVAPKGALLIRQAGPHNIGEYRCRMKLGAKEEEAAANLIIIERPGMPKSVKAEVIINDKKLPKVTISWREGFNGNSPVLKHVIEMQTLATASAHPHWSDWERIADNVESCCSYTLESVRPSSTAAFRVAAVNKHGLGRFSLPSPNITLPQMPPAAAPTKVHATARSARTVMVQWQRPASQDWNGDIDGYYVRHRLAGYNIPWITNRIDDGQRLNYAVEGLLVWKEYEFQVAAFNKEGNGVFSTSVRATTLEGAPTQSPKGVSVSVLNSTAISVRFEQPDEQFINGVNLGYKVQLRLMKPSEKDGQGFVVDEAAHVYSEQRVEPDSYEMETLIGGLEPWTHAQLTVLCYTQAGEGPASTPVTLVTHESTPSPVGNLNVDEVESFRAKVQWERPKKANGRITKYDIRYWSDYAPADVRTSTVEGTETIFWLNDLTASTRYTVDVRAATSKGDGPREEVRFMSGVPPELPGRPSALAVSEVKARSVSLSFNPGFDGHSPIRTWHVEAKQGDGRAGIFAAVFNTSAPKARALTVTGLRPHTTYQLRLIAENVKGRGAPSEATKMFKTSPAPPDAPSPKLWAEPNSATSITLSWTPLQTHQWNGDPIGYLIVYRKAPRGGSNQTRGRNSEEMEEEEENEKHELRTASLRATEITLRDLSPWTEYEIELYAENVEGRSVAAGAPNAPPIRARTYESAPSLAPADVRIEPRGERGAIVQWNEVPSEGAGGEIIGYTVRLTPSDGLPEYRREPLSRVSQIASPDQLTESFSNLRAATTYKVTVTARTLIGEGPPSKDALVRTGDDIPGKPSRLFFTLVSPNEVKLKFFPPDDPNGVITQYLVTYHGADDVDPEATKVTAPVPPTMFTFSAVGLTPKKKYVFGVSAQNAEGAGEPALVEVWTAQPNDMLPLPNPSMPRADVRRPHSSNEISLTWSEEKAGETLKDDDFPQAVRAVEVEYQRANAGNWTKYPVSVDGTTRVATIGGLSPNTAYAFRIRFVGDYATTSAWSAESGWERTLAAAPARPPREIIVTPEDADSITVAMSPPERSSWNADALGYTIYYREYPSDGQWEQAEVKAATDETAKIRYSIKSLKAFRHYIVQLRSTNAEGSSPASTPSFVYVGFAVPKATVSGLLVEPLSSTSLAVRWDALPRDQITGYKVRYAPIVSVLRPESELDGLMVVEENEATVENLLKYTEYQISVVPYNRAGEGGSASARVSTLEDVPGAVTKIDFNDILLNSVNVSWSAPAERNGEIISYVVAWKMGTIRGDTRQESQQTTSNQWLLAERLVEGETYHFSVQAETRKGKGALSEGTVVVGPVVGGPSSPSKPSLVPGAASVRLQWEDRVQNGPEATPIIGHVIQAKRVARALGNMTTMMRTPAAEEDNLHRKRRSHSGKRPVHAMEEWITVAVVDGIDPRAELHYGDLHPLSYYIFRVFARNAKGVGAPSAESAQLFVPQNLPSELFYTSPWFVAVAGLILLVLLVIIIACLCVTGVSSRSSAKKSPSSHSLHYDGNFPMQLKDNRSHLRRGDVIARPGTNTSWLSERDMYGGPPAYGLVGGGSRVPGGAGSTGGDSGNGGSSPDAGGGPINMYGLATDVIPHHQQNLQHLQHEGSEYGSRIPPGLGTSIGRGPNSIYGTATIRAHNGQMAREYDADSFDDDFDDEEDEGEETMRRRDETREDIASHYATADKYSRDTWRRVRDTEAVSMRAAGGPPAAHHLQLPPAFAAPAAPPGAPSASGSVVSARTSSHAAPDSLESASETSWPPSQSGGTAAPALSKGFSSFV